jgi:diguanylate cyclase (GGDEF)-like protein/PAS domain S-box-containing protein
VALVAIGTKAEKNMQELQSFQQLEDSRRFLECVTLAEPNLLYIFDLEIGQIVFANNEITATLGYTQANIEEMGSEIVTRLVHPEDLPHIREHQERYIQAGDGDVLEIEYRLRLAFGDWHWFSSRDTVYSRSPEGKVKQILGIAVDISERRAAQEKLRFVSTHDALTGLYNRVMFETEVDRLEKSRRYPVTILMADVVGMHKINQEHGYEAGDGHLRKLAELLRDAFRSDDVVARLGADKFGVLLPTTSNNASEAVQARVRNRLANYNQQHPKTPLAISLSVVSAENGQSLREALLAAEKRLALTKNSR